MSRKKQERKTAMESIWKWIIENWVSTAIGVVVIPWLVFYVLPNCWNNNISVIKISPKTKNIICDNRQYRKETFYVYLSNNSSNPIYDINVISHHPKEVGVTIFPEKGRPESVPFGSMNVGTTFAISGYDTKNLGFTQTVINNLAPKETIKLSVEIDKKDYYNNFELRTEAKFNSKTPKPIFSSK